MKVKIIGLGLVLLLGATAYFILNSPHRMARISTMCNSIFTEDIANKKDVKKKSLLVSIL